MQVNRVPWCPGRTARRIRRQPKVSTISMEASMEVDLKARPERVHGKDAQQRLEFRPNDLGPIWDRSCGTFRSLLAVQGRRFSKRRAGRPTHGRRKLESDEMSVVIWSCYRSRVPEHVEVGLPPLSKLRVDLPSFPTLPTTKQTCPRSGATAEQLP